MERIVFLDRQSLKANVRRPAFPHEWEEHAQTPEAEVAQRLSGATIAITNKVPIRRATLEKLPHLKMIAVAATGYDVIDIDACRERGVAVANIRNYAVHTVPEHTFAMIFALRRNLIAYREDVLPVAGRRRISSASSIIRLQTCMAARSVSSVKVRLDKRPLSSRARSVCACCSPITRRRRRRGLSSAIRIRSLLNRTSSRCTAR